MESLPRKLKSLGVLVPGLNEAAVLPVLYAELVRSLGANEWSLEILFVDDGSTDETLFIWRFHRCTARISFESNADPHRLGCRLGFARIRLIIVGSLKSSFPGVLPF